MLFINPKIFGAARNIERGGSSLIQPLTETGSKWMKLYLKNLKEQEIWTSIG